MIVCTECSVPEHRRRVTHTPLCASCVTTALVLPPTVDCTTVTHRGVTYPLRTRFVRKMSCSYYETGVTIGGRDYYELGETVAIARKNLLGILHNVR